MRWLRPNSKPNARTLFEAFTATSSDVVPECSFVKCDSAANSLPNDLIDKCKGVHLDSKDSPTQNACHRKMRVTSFPRKQVRRSRLSGERNADSKTSISKRVQQWA